MKLAAMDQRLEAARGPAAVHRGRSAAPRADHTISVGLHTCADIQ